MGPAPLFLLQLPGRGPRFAWEGVLGRRAMEGRALQAYLGGTRLNPSHDNQPTVRQSNFDEWRAQGVSCERYSSRAPAALAGQTASNLKGTDSKGIHPPLCGHLCPQVVEMPCFRPCYDMGGVQHLRWPGDSQRPSGRFA